MPRLLATVGPRPDAGWSIPAAVPKSRALTGHPPEVSNGLGLGLDVGEEGAVVAPLQPLGDEGSEDDLKAHGKLELGRRFPHNDPDLVEDVLREVEQDFGHRLRKHAIYFSVGL
jgi:hypothetical protein